MRRDVAPAMRVLAVSGSLRSGSTNHAALLTAAEVAPPELDVVVFDGIDALPAFNPDLDRAPLPPAVEAARAAVRDADAVLVSTPEYAGDLPGAFKNWLDWLVGDDQAGSMYGKPVAWLNVSARGAPDAHASLRRVLGYLSARVVEDASIDVPVSHKAALTGTLGDEPTRAAIRGAVTALADALR